MLSTVSVECAFSSFEFEVERLKPLLAPNNQFVNHNVPGNIFVRVKTEHHAFRDFAIYGNQIFDPSLLVEGRGQELLAYVFQLRRNTHSLT